MGEVYGSWNWRRAVAESALPSTTKLVLLTLSIHVPESGHGAFPSVKRLTRETSLTRKTVQKHLLESHRLGWISKESRHAENGRQTSNFYRLAVPGGEGVSNDPPGGVSSTQGEGVSSTHPVSLKGQRRNGKEDRGADPEQGELLPAGPPARGRAKKDEFEALWLLARTGSKKRAWEEYRKAVPSSTADPGLIHGARKRYAEHARRESFTPAALFRWLRDERWEEYIETANDPEPGSVEWLRAEQERILSGR